MLYGHGKSSLQCRRCEEINAPPYLGFTTLASTAKHVAIGLARIGCNSEYTGVIWPLVQYAWPSPANLVFALCNCLLCIAAPFSYECLKKVAIVLINKV